MKMTEVNIMNRMNELENGLIVSCYADWSINPYMDDDTAIVCVARSCLSGGARAIRTNLDHVRAVRDAIDAPLIGIKKVYRQGKEDPTDFRITPTMKEVDALVMAGADGIAIDGTIRDRYDDTPLDVFIHQIKEKYPDLFLIADISTLEEWIFCYRNGVDIVGTTLSGYTPYSRNPVVFGTVPQPDPDYELIRELKEAGVERVIAEGRINDGHKMRKCFDAGAFAVVIGTSISEPAKIVKTILNDSKE
ncbi:MAG: putative N-acetylmannosamine-6-phosphate 2-epimerase [Erysipelotrichaceae bacterium]|nr:putative N-acetylmannosamine-6-phosphate 2-epimerase [Erysipelotrichaceae bacterium]